MILRIRDVVTSMSAEEKQDAIKELQQYTPHMKRSEAFKATLIDYIRSEI